MATKHKPSFGVRIPVAGPLANPTDIARSAVAAEKLGFEVAWVHDYVCWNKQLDSAHISCGSKKSFSDAANRSD